MKNIFLVLLLLPLLCFSQNAQIRQEVNIISDNYSTSVSTTSVGKGRINADNYGGTVSFYFEIVAYHTTTSIGSTTVALRRSGTTTDDASVQVATNHTTPVIYRSTAFTPPSGTTEYNVFNFGTGGLSLVIRQARIVVIQQGSSSSIPITEGTFSMNKVPTTIYTNQSPAAALTNPYYWKYNSANYDGTVSFSAEAVYRVNNTTCTIVIQEADGTGDGFQNFATIATLVNAGSATSSTYASATFTPTDGRWYRIATHRGGGGGTRQYWIENSAIVVTQTGTITKTETQYLVQPATAASNPSLWGRADWEPNEWANVTNSYYFQLETVDNATMTAVLKKISDGGTLSGSTVTNPDNAGVSSSITMPGSSDELYPERTAGTSLGHAARLIVVVSGAPPAAKPRRVYITNNNNNEKNPNFTVVYSD